MSYLLISHDSNCGYSFSITRLFRCSTLNPQPSTLPCPPTCPPKVHRRRNPSTHNSQLTTPWALRSSPLPLCPMPHAPCPMLHAPCSMPLAPCLNLLSFPFIFLILAINYLDKNKAPRAIEIKNQEVLRFYHYIN